MSGIVGIHPLFAGVDTHDDELAPRIVLMRTADAFGRPRNGPDDLADARACGYAAGPRGQSGGRAGRARRVTCPGRSSEGTATGQLASAQTVRPE